MRPRIFNTAADLRRWLEANHAATPEIWLSLRKAGARCPGVTYAEALDLALCFGWIDGVRHPFDHEYFSVRFTPRKRRSIWSKINLRHYERLEKMGLVAAPGRAVFQQRDPKRSGLYSLESRRKQLPPAYRRRFQANPTAWSFFQSQPPGDQRIATFWVVSAKQEVTRKRRLAQLITDSAQGRRLRMLTRPAARKPAS